MEKFVKDKVKRKRFNEPKIFNLLKKKVPDRYAHAVAPEFIEQPIRCTLEYLAKIYPATNLELINETSDNQTLKVRLKENKGVGNGLGSNSKSTQEDADVLEATFASQCTVRSDSSISLNSEEIQEGLGVSCKSKLKKKLEAQKKTK